VLGVFEGHLTLDLKSVNHVVHTDITVIHEGVKVLVNNPLKDNLKQVIVLGRGQ
jgi:hypothetical protein